MREWVVIGKAGALACLAPLIDAQRRRGPVRIMAADDMVPLPPARWLDAPGAASAALVIHSPEVSPGRAAPGPVMRVGGRLVPVGLLPDVPERLATYAATAVRVLSRKQVGAPRSAVLLGDRSDRTARAADALAAGHDRAEGFRLFRWTADRIRRDQLMDALGGGFGAALYVGHGVPSGWIGYGGIGPDQVARFTGSPVGAVLALTCDSAARPRGRWSLAESMVFAGLAASVLAAPGKTGHRGNVVMAASMLERLAAEGPITLGELVVSEIHAGRNLSQFRIIGDPSLPLASTRDARAWGARVPAPAPDGPLPPLTPEEWPRLTLPLSRDGLT